MDGMGRFPKAPVAGPRLGGSPAITSGTGYPWVDGDVLYAADLNAAFAEAGPAEAAALNSVGRNLIHNPLINVAQRGFGPWTTSGYTMDRWKLAVNLDTMNLQIISASDATRVVVGDESLIRNFQANFAGSAAGGAYSQLVQPIEGIRRISGKTIIVSFWAGANVAALKLGVSLYQNFGSGGSPSAAVFIAGQTAVLTTSFARYSLVFSIPSANGKTLGTNGDDFTQLTFTFSDPAGIGVQSGDISLWGVQLEVGSVVTPLEKPDPQQDLAKCQRFFQTGQFSHVGYGSVNAYCTQTQSFSTTMRAIPTVVPTYTSTANSTAYAVQGLTPSQMTVSGQVLSGPGNMFLAGSYTASADL